MRHEGVPPTPAEGTSVLAASPAGAGLLATTGAGAAQADATIALPKLRLPRGRVLALPRVIYGATAGRAALATLVLGTLALVVFETAGPTVLVPRSNKEFPAWESGPLHGLFGTLHASSSSSAVAINWSVSGLLIVMLLAYGVALAAVRTLSMRSIVF